MRGYETGRVQHGVDWWESIKDWRWVCLCGDFYPCMRMRSRIRAEQRHEDEHWQSSYADELLAGLPQFGVRRPAGRGRS